MNISKTLLIGFISTFGIANAATTTYSLDQNNSGLPNGFEYGTVTLSDGIDAGDANNVDFLVEIYVDEFAPVGDNFGMDAFFFNFNNDLDVSAANIIDIDPADWDINTNKNAGGGYGFFDIQAKGTGNSRTVALSFSIANIFGDTIADYAIAGDDSYYFAAHVGGFGEDGDFSTKLAGPGFDGEDPPEVPVPAAIWLMGSALGGLGFMRRKQAKS